ncbi:MAG: zinc metallopeptidase [Anaerococcus sp.]|nr:zinc metallopeptidase [Anaerococcus sp.]MDD7045276.1 zinc metallopeptidase [Peptoniphilaceae bacterium]MDY2919447.1 zinc metallopeptidase [Anaerococcus sp.]
MFGAYMYRGLYFDKTYLLVLLGLIITMFAQAKVQSAFSKYSKIKSKKSISGLDAAKYILDVNSYNDISIKRVRGSMSDYFNPATKQIALSDHTLKDTSIASIAVACHECGHVIQYKEGFLPLKLKSLIVPVVNFGSSLSFPLILLGLFMANQLFINIGLFLFSFMLIFQLITLPVEFDASRRAVAVMRDSGMLVGEEVDHARAMLRAAAFTYVAATLSTALQFLRLFLLFGDRDDR